jgi:hypothetical protein
MKRWFPRAGLALVAAIVGIEFVPVAQTNPPEAVQLEAPQGAEAEGDRRAVGKKQDAALVLNSIVSGGRARTDHQVGQTDVGK